MHGEICTERRACWGDRTRFGVVERGARRGRALGYPTANLPVTSDVMVPDGVYAGQAWIKQGLHKALINIGRAPTFGNEARRVEVHLLKAQEEELYGETMTLLLH
ncbi:MAG: riboflavin kinase [Candidatus Methylomirabilis sp.]|nr:riboflavin kinase [Candidatus Methylomirabilis sp.]